MPRTLELSCLLALALLGLHSAARAQGQPGELLGLTTITKDTGGFTGVLPDNTYFGQSVAVLGDVDGDGHDDIAVGSPLYGDAGGQTGSVWILLLRQDGTVKAHQRISAAVGGLTADLDDGERFGLSLAAPGDIDGDGVPDLAVGSRGAVGLDLTPQPTLWMLMLTASGTVKAHVEIRPGLGGLPDVAAPVTLFMDHGEVLAAPGDVDGDGLGDLATVSYASGKVMTLFLGADGSVRSWNAFGAEDVQPGVDVVGSTGFARQLGPFGDFDGDGVVDLVLGGRYLPERLPLIALLRADGSLKFARQITDPDGLIDDLSFNNSGVGLGDLDGDGMLDLALHEDISQHDDVWVALLRPDGRIRAAVQVAGGPGQQQTGYALARAGDLDGDGRPDLLAGQSEPINQFAPNQPGRVHELLLNTRILEDLGFGVAGTAGTPRLELAGPLTPGSPTTLALTSAAARQPAWLVVGLSVSSMPFIGGVLVPSPDLALLLGATDNTGALEFTGPWPLGVPMHTTFAFHAWVPDAGAPLGWSASNALKAVTP